MMHVVLVLNSEDGGGVLTLVRTIATGLRARGISVETVALRGRNRSAIQGLARMVTQLFKVRPGAVFSFNPASSVVAALVGSAAGVRVRVAHQTAIPNEVKPVWRLLDRIFGTMGMYSHVVTNSGATTHEFSSYPASYRQRIVEVPHGVSRLVPSSPRISWRRHLSIAVGVPMLATSGRLAAQKNHATAIRALQHVPGAHLAIAGDGPDRAELEELAGSLALSGRVHLLGELPAEALADLLLDANCFVFPSVWESFGIAPVEAAMLGVPIVAADLPVLREVLNVGPGAARCVRYHPPLDFMALARQVRESLTEPASSEERTSFAAEASALHSVDVMIERLSDLLPTEG